MSSDVDWETVARFNLYEFLLELMMAHGLGQDEIARWRAEVVDAMVNRGKMAHLLSAEDEAERKLNAKAVTERFFDRVAARRAEIDRR